MLERQSAFMPESLPTPMPVAPDGHDVRAAGLDVVDVDRLALAVRRSGPRLLDRLFDDRERAACADGQHAAIMAGLFGIKESVVKVLGGLPRGASYRDVSIDVDAVGPHSGPLPVRLSGVLADQRPSLTVGAHTLVADGLVVSWALALRNEALC